MREEWWGRDGGEMRDGWRDGWRRGREGHYLGRFDLNLPSAWHIVEGMFVADAKRSHISSYFGRRIKTSCCKRRNAYEMPNNV